MQFTGVGHAATRALQNLFMPPANAVHPDSRSCWHVSHGCHCPALCICIDQRTLIHSLAGLPALSLAVLVFVDLAAYPAYRPLIGSPRFYIS